MLLTVYGVHELVNRLEVNAYFCVLVGQVQASCCKSSSSRNYLSHTGDQGPGHTKDADHWCQYLLDLLLDEL